MRRTRERELSAELQSHLEMHVADNIRAGMTPEEARRRALVALGGMEPTKERYRDERRWRPLEELARDLMFAVRGLTRDRGFAITAVLVLGVGLAVVNTFGILMNAILLRGVPIDEPSRAFMMRARDTADRNVGMSYEDYRDLRTPAMSAIAIGAFRWSPMTVGDATHAVEQFIGAYVSANVFGLIGERPLAGRDFLPQDDEPGAPPVVILGRSVWESRYGGNPGLIGSTLRVNGVVTTVVGVMPDRSKFPSDAAIWQPLAAMPGLAQQSRGSRILDVFGRLAPSSSIGDVRGEFQSRWVDLSRRYPATNANLRLVVMPINEYYVGDPTHPAWIAFIAAGFLILAVACANVANLLIMRGTHRGREIAVRLSLGATRARIFRQLLAESMVLAFLGGAVGLLISTIGARLLWVSQPDGTLPHWMRFTMDPPMFALLAMVCLGSAIVFGVVPAYQGSRGDLAPALASGTRGSSHGVPSRWLTSILLVAQFAVALGSLISISAVARQVADTNGIPDSAARGLLTMSIALPGDRYRTAEQRNQFYDRLRSEFEAIEGVTQVAFASNLPLGGAATRALILEGYDPSSGAARPMVRSLTVSRGYFDTLHVPLLRGRSFSEDDGPAEPMPVIINQRFADLHFGARDPIGTRMTLLIDSQPKHFTVVGVSPNIKQTTARGPGSAAPIVYFPLRGTAPAQMALMVRGKSDQVAMASALRDAIKKVDVDVPLYRMMSLEESIQELDWNTRFSNVIATVAGMLAVLLSAVGLFALTAHVVAWMTPEIGVRTALGARPRHVLKRVLRRAAAQVIAGIVAGVAFALAWSRMFQATPSNTSLLDFMIAALVLTLVSMAACLVPAIRALRVNPLVALRYD